MDEVVASLPPRRTLLSLHILLPEAIDRRLERWTRQMPGTSWPSWGGHVTLVPNFVARGSVEEVHARVQAVCATETPFTVRFGAPIAVPDMTRPNYFAVFLTVEEVLTKEVPVKEGQANAAGSRLQALRPKLLAALESLREDVKPQLVEQAFLPHVTLALGLGESEARNLVKQMRGEPLVAEFKIEAIWLVKQSFGEGARFERQPIPLGRAATTMIL